ncbi:2-dehydropantoate 2-reductase [Alicyclobacillus suci]|uniref:2-dehydropantoate 2-reductase n=1 Tax=Alicyclobacillus suci TaxID=2816080 RepID=UPI0022A75A1B|nr:2-dehydropantoate 2-reductase [Alicyclobacillus suci]
MQNAHLNDAIPQIRRLVEKGAKILPLLNGIQHMDTLLSEFGKAAVLGGVCYIEATLDAQGAIIHTSPMHDIVFGTLQATNQPLVNELERAFRQSGVNVQQSPSIMEEVWKKFIFLTAFSGITAATRKPIGEILSDTISKDFLHDMIAEIVSVAQAKQGTRLPNAREEVMRKLEAVSPAMTSSLHRDLEKGLPLEIDSLQGSVLEMAKTYAIPVPCIRAIYAVLHPYVEGERA